MSDGAKDTTTTVRLTAAEKAEARAMAKERGVRGYSALFRLLLREARQRSAGGRPAAGFTAAEKQLMAELAGQVRIVGNLLNQQVRALNLIAKGVASPPPMPRTEEIEAVRAQVERMVERATDIVGEIERRLKD